MSIRPIVTLGDPRLRIKGEPVTSFGKFLGHLLDDLTHTMRDAPGVGLAAPQIGEALSVCVVEVEDRLHELVNPRIIRTEGEDRDLEGCLSIPGYAAYVTRKEKVWVVAQDRRGRRYKVAGSGLLGRAFQHELDHLDGKLYIDYLDSMDELIPVGLGDDEEGVAPGDAGDGGAAKPKARSRGEGSRAKPPALA
jgi:peptide deformylase